MSVISFLLATLKRARVGLGDGFVGDSRAAEVTLAGTLLPVVEVGLATLRAYYLARGRHFHALSGALFSFHLRHIYVPFSFLTVRAVGIKPDPDGIVK